MESPQSVVSPLKTSSVYPDPEKHNLDHFTKNPSFESKKPEPTIGVLEVYIHQARDIQNICIYHKQDVYAKICFTNNPEKSVTTQTINGGGQNPVFNQNLYIDVPTIDSTLKCEIYMLSRVRNYLEDQLLGFTLIPLSDVFIKNGKLEKEFSLSSNDLFHSPSGFVQLSLSYNGVSPDVIAIPPNRVETESEANVTELDKLEFPDPKIANENQMMVSEYFGISSESLVSSDTDDQGSSENGASFVFETAKPGSPPASVSTNGSQCGSGPVESTESEESDGSRNKWVEVGSMGGSRNKPFEGGSRNKPVEVGSMNDSRNEPVEVGSMNGSRNEPVEGGSMGGSRNEVVKVGSMDGSRNDPVEDGSRNTVVEGGSMGGSRNVVVEGGSRNMVVEGGSMGGSRNEAVEGGSRNEAVEGGSMGGSRNKVAAMAVNMEMDQKVVQQDFVDLYMKSMQQFTESLAKMKLPLEMEKEQQTSSGNSSSDQTTKTPRVFYGSRAFF